MKLIHFFIFLTICFPLKSQSILIDSIPYSSKYEIYTFYGADIKFLCQFDSVPFNFTLPDDYKGFFRIKNSDFFEDFIFDSERFKISLLNNGTKNWKSITDSKYNNSLQSIRSLWKNYSQMNDSVKNLNERDSKIDSVLNLYPGSFFTQSTRIALIPTNGLTPKEIVDLIPLSEKALLHCSIIPNMIIKSFKAIGKNDNDRLMEVLSYIYSKKIDDEINKMITEFIINFLTETNADEILDFFLTDILKENHCDYNFSENAEFKMNQLIIQKTGAVLPDVLINNKKLSRQLKKFRDKEIVLIIWSKDCPHCSDLLDKLKPSESTTYIGIEISGSAHDLPDYTAFSLQIKDELGWDGELAKKWMINRTPTIFKITPNLKIIEVINQMN